MDKLSVLFLFCLSFIFFISLNFVSAQEEYSCIDTDNGLDYYTQGNVTYGKYDYKDHCGSPGVVNAGTSQEYTIVEGDLLEYACYGSDNDKRCTDTACRFIKYNCPNGCRDGACLKEKESSSEEVKCIFVNSKTEQRCYVAGGEESCSGVESCTTKISGSYGEKITWKSTCGGYGYSLNDGRSDSIKFECISGEVNKTDLSGKGFRYAYWECQDGEKSKNQDDTSCKTSETWQQYTLEFCKNRCDKSSGKCGVNSFSVNNECYLDEDSSIKIPDNETFIPLPSPIFPDKEITICKDSCPLDGKCYPFSYRKDGEYCSDKSTFEPQFKEDSFCENNFECSSNFCVSGKCVSPGLIEKILEWFKNIFG
ncbi:hypothetical protein HY448_00480 [Candidatus Pacearchaeota archaeon]|nr:hypothetical protein [Candidatus Pacearchaeota archaeon]